MNRTACLLILFGCFYCAHLGCSETAAAQVLQLSPFGTPVGRTPLVAARNGHLYLLDDYTNRLFICDPSGHILHTVGSIGDGPGQFYRPSAMVITSRSIVVFDKGNRRIEVLSLDGAFQRDFAVHGDIFSMAAGDDGRVYVNDPSSGSLITVLSADGKIMKSFGALSSVSSLYRTSDRSRDDQFRLQANRVRLAVDKSEHIYATFLIVPVIREYSTDGSLVQEVAISGETARRLADTFWHGAKEARIVSGVIDGKQVPFLIKGISVDPATHHLLVLTAFSTVFIFEADCRQINQIEVRGVLDWQLWSMAVEGRSIWFVRTFLPGSFRGELPPT